MKLLISGNQHLNLIELHSAPILLSYSSVVVGSLRCFFIAEARPHDAVRAYSLVTLTAFCKRFLVCTVQLAICNFLFSASGS